MSVDLVVVGLGRVGLPAAVRAALAGLRVVGLDVDPRRVGIINGGRSPFIDEAQLDSAIPRLVASDLLTAVTDPRVVSDAGAVIIAVPLWLDSLRQPDFSFVDAAVASVGDHLSADTVVITETTLPVGTTRTRIAPELARRSGLELGEGLLVAFSPERVKVGRVIEDLDRYPKVVGGVDPASTRAAGGFYERYLRSVLTVSDADTAEFVKLAETAYRDLNIALANELGDAADRVGVGFAEVRSAANTQPESHLHTPGIGVGGHCIPVYPHLFNWSVAGLDLVMAGRAKNEARPHHYRATMEGILGELHGRTAVILGAAYRPELDLVEHSSLFPLVEALMDAGMHVEVIDPVVGVERLESVGLVAGSLQSDYDVAIIHTAHEAFRDQAYSSLAPVLVDGRGLFAADPPSDVDYYAPGFRALRRG